MPLISVGTAMIAAQAEIFDVLVLAEARLRDVRGENLCKQLPKLADRRGDPQQMVVDVAEVGPHLVRNHALQSQARSSTDGRSGVTAW